MFQFYSVDYQYFKLVRDLFLYVSIVTNKKIIMT